MGQIVQHLRVHDRMRFEHLMIGCREAEAREIAVDEAQKPRQHKLRQPQRPAPTALREHVKGFTEHVLWDEVVSAAQTDERSLGRLCCVARDIAAGISRADNKDTFAAEFVGSAIRRGVTRLTGERPGERWYARMPVGAARGDDGAVDPLLTVRKPNPPTCAGSLDAVDHCVEANVLLQPVGAGERPEVGQNLPVGGVVGILRGHWKIEKMRARL